MVEEKQEYEMGLPNGVGEHKLIGEYEELVKVREFLENAIRERLEELEK